MEGLELTRVCAQARSRKSLCCFPSTCKHVKISHACYVVTKIGKVFRPITINSYFTGIFTFFRVLILSLSSRAILTVALF